jgi:hypothetical protein
MCGCGVGGEAVERQHEGRAGRHSSRDLWVAPRVKRGPRLQHAFRIEVEQCLVACSWPFTRSRVWQSSSRAVLCAGRCEQARAEAAGVKLEGRFVTASLASASAQ